VNISQGLQIKHFPILSEVASHGLTSFQRSSHFLWRTLSRKCHEVEGWTPGTGPFLDAPKHPN
jgi:hypothetical protein